MKGVGELWLLARVSVYCRYAARLCRLVRIKEAEELAPPAVKPALVVHTCWIRVTEVDTERVLSVSAEVSTDDCSCSYKMKQ